MRYAAIAFDLDGTLVDSAPDLHAAANRMLAELGRPALTLPQVTSFIGNGVPKLVERCLEATGGGGDLHADGLARFRAHYDAAPANLTRPWPGVPEAARRLRAAGLPLGICTNKPEGPARKLLALLGLDDLFASVIGGDTLPEHKPQPEPLIRCLAELGADPARTLYVGDSETDAETAANAGIPFALYTRGYRKRPVEGFVAVLAFDDWAELPDHVAAPAPASDAAS
jgi:phosphoglycolate phosphatase